MSEDIHELFRKVREHPDFVFGTIFVTGDFPNPKSAELFREGHARYATDLLAERGNYLIDDAGLGLSSCEECENDIPMVGEGLANKYHAPTCSLYDPEKE